MRKAFGVVVLLALAVVVRAQEAAAEKDLKAMEGTWTVIVHEVDGQKTPDKDTKKAEVRITIKSGTYTVFFGDTQIVTGKIKLDAGKKPRQINATATEGEFKDKTMPGIYEIKGDTMRVCFAMPGKERPTEFRTREKTGEMLLSYKRVK